MWWLISDHENLLCSAQLPQWNALITIPFFFFLCGRLVLSAVSDYFAAMFTSDVRDAKQEEIKMEGVDPEALRSLVHFAYTGECS